MNFLHKTNFLNIRYYFLPLWSVPSILPGVTTKPYNSVINGTYDHGIPMMGKKGR